MPSLPSAPANWTTTTETANAPQRLQRSSSGAGEAAQQLQDLTFVNMTDPQQSKTRESRKFVRRQVMVNFAREKRRQQKPTSPGGTQVGTSTSNTVSGVQELLNAAMPTAEDASMVDWSLEGAAPGLDKPSRHNPSDPPTQVAPESPTTGRSGHSSRPRSKPGPHLPAAPSLPITFSSSSNLPGVELPRWPIAPETHVQDLVDHCKTGSLPSRAPIVRHSDLLLHLGHSLLFRACHPQYMISLLANRPSAENYPFFVDVDSAEDVNPDHGAKHAEDSEFYRLAEGSSMLAHALLMVSASHLALVEPEDAATRTRQAINHKSKALQLLNEATKGLPGNNYLETLATIAVLASHEVSFIINHLHLQTTKADSVLVDGQS